MMDRTLELRWFSCTDLALAWAGSTLVRTSMKHEMILVIRGKADIIDKRP